MKTLLKSIGVVATLVLIFMVGCQKNINYDITSNNTETTFNVAEAKSWFSTTFATTPQHKTVELMDKKNIDWSKPTFYKIATVEFIELPLLKSKSSFPIPSGISEADRQRIASASISKAIIKKDKNGVITIEEYDLIPDFAYLKSKNFDISKISINDDKTDFTGKLLVKDWNSNILKIKLLNNGKITNNILIKKKNSNETSNVLGECTPGCSCQVMCLYERWCEYHTDGLEVCGPWVQIGECWIEEISCEDPGGGGGGNAECDNLSQAAAQSILDAVSSQITYNQTSQSGSESSPDVNGIIRMPTTKSGVGLTLHVYGQYSPHWDTKYAGVIFKTTNNSTWKWESFNFTGVQQTSGQMAPCISSEITTNIATAISGNGLTAMAAGDYSVTLTCSCLMGMAVGSPWVVQLGNYDHFTAQP